MERCQTERRSMLRTPRAGKNLDHPRGWLSCVSAFHLDQPARLTGTLMHDERVLTAPREPNLHHALLSPRCH